jgi:hypothetical protein
METNLLLSYQIGDTTIVPWRDTKMKVVLLLSRVERQKVGKERARHYYY